jgi:hypothetical protein
MTTATRLRMANLNHPQPRPSERQNTAIWQVLRAVRIASGRSVCEYMWPGGEAIASISDRATGNRWPPPFSTVTCSGNSDLSETTVCRENAGSPGRYSFFAGPVAYQNPTRVAAMEISYWNFRLMWVDIRTGQMSVKIDRAM